MRIAHRRRIALLATLAMLAAALAPAITHALGASRTPAWAAFLCSAASGPRDGGEGPTTPHAQGEAHCPFCSFDGGCKAPPPRAELPLLVPARGPAPAGIAVAAPAWRSAWAAVQPRAPPPAC